MFIVNVLMLTSNVDKKEQIATFDWKVPINLISFVLKRYYMAYRLENWFHFIIYLLLFHLFFLSLNIFFTH